MARYSFFPYIIKLKERNTNNNYNLSSIPTENGNRSLFQILNSFFELYDDDAYHNDERQKTFHVHDIHTSDNTILYGRIKSGEYGYSGDFFNVEQNLLTPNARTVNDSEELPFYFMINTNLPLRNTDMALMILQKFKNFGTKSLLYAALKEYVEGLGNHTFQMNHIISNDLMNKLNNVDRIVKLRLLKREIPRDTAEVHMINNYNDIAEERVFKIKNRREFDGIQFLNNLTHNELIRRLRNVDYPYNEIEEEHYDEIKIETQTGDSTDTIELSEQGKFREKFVINEEELNTENGHPTLDSIKPIGVRYMNRILETYNEAPIEINDEGENDNN